MRLRSFLGGAFLRAQAVVLLFLAWVLAASIPECAGAQDLTGVVRDSWTGMARDPQRFHTRPGFTMDLRGQAALFAERFPSGVSLRLLPQSSLLAGSGVGIAVRSDRDGHLVLLDIDAAGQLVQIFPNTQSLRAGEPRRVLADQEILLPGIHVGSLLGAGHLTGQGTLMAVVVPGKNTRLRDLVSRHENLSAVEHPNAYFAELVEALGIGSGAVAGALAYEWIVQKE